MELNGAACMQTFQIYMQAFTGAALSTIKLPASRTVVAKLATAVHQKSGPRSDQPLLFRCTVHKQPPELYKATLGSHVCSPLPQ